MFNYKLTYYNLNDIVIPALNHFKLNPHVKTVETYIKAFFKKNGVLPATLPSETIPFPESKYDSLIESDIVLLGALFFPEVDESDLFFLSVFLHYFFFHDDLVEDESLNVTDVEIMNQSHLPLLKNIVNTVENDLCLKICQYLGENFFDLNLNKFDHFFDKLENNYYCGAVKLKEILVSAPENFTEERFIELRRPTGGALEVLQLCLATSKHPVAIESFFDKYIEELFDIANDIILFTNDIVSYEKEKENRAARYANYVTFMQHFRGYNLEQAKFYVLTKIEERCQDFIKKINSFLLCAPAQLEIIHYLGIMIGANLAWSISTRRYNLNAALRISVINDINIIKKYVVPNTIEYVDTKKQQKRFLQQLSKEVTEFCRELFTEGPDQYIAKLFLNTHDCLVHHVSITRRPGISCQKAIQFYSFLAKTVEIATNESTLVARIFVASSSDCRGNEGSVLFFIREMIKLLFHYYFTFKEIYFYGELTPTTYYLVSKYASKFYPNPDEKYSYLNNIYEKLTEHFTGVNINDPRRELPKYPVDKKDCILQTKRNNPSIVHYLKYNPRPEEGYVLPTIIKISPVEILMILFYLAIDRLYRFGRLFICNTTNLSWSFFSKNFNRDASQASQEKYHKLS